MQARPRLESASFQHLQPNEREACFQLERWFLSLHPSLQQGRDGLRRAGAREELAVLLERLHRQLARDQRARARDQLRSGGDTWERGMHGCPLRPTS